MPVEHEVCVRYAAFVAEWRLTSVNANGASPQFETTTVDDWLLPTGCCPKDSVSALMQIREAPYAATARPHAANAPIRQAGRRRRRMAAGKRQRAHKRCCAVCRLLQVRRVEEADD